MEEVFKIKSYSWQELGLLYSPELTPVSAARRLKRWVHLHGRLKKALLKEGWIETSRVLTPQLVKVIVLYLGEP